MSARLIHSKNVLQISAAMLGFASLSLAQSGPQIAVSPGTITTAAGRTNEALAAASFNGVAVRGSTLYVSDSHVARYDANNNPVYVANVYAVNTDNGQVTRVAGTAPDPVNGNAGYQNIGDNGPAVNAILYKPAGLAIDGAGNLYIADSGQNAIRKVDTNGIISTVAGNGNPTLGTSSGDAGPATSAQLNFPTAVAVNATGDIFISDTFSSKIRMVSASSHIINTVAGNGSSGFSGDNGQAVNATLNVPVGIAVDAANNLYIADRGNNVIRVVSNGIINTVAGQGGQEGFADGAGSSSLLKSPDDVAVDQAGTVYVSDSGNNRIRRIATDGARTVTTLAGTGAAVYSGDGGPASTAGLNSPTNITLSGAGTLFFVDNAFAAVRRITATAAPVVFPLTAVGSSNSTTVSVSNTGNQTLNVSQINPPSNFTVTGGSCGSTPSLTAGTSCTLVLTFTPTNGGSTSGTLTLVSNAANSATTSVFLSMSNGLYFVPLQPCRVVDTRWPTNTFGGPFIAGGATRSFAIRFSSNTDSNSYPGACGSAPISGNADVQAYSLNVTVVPKRTLRWLTVAPKFQDPPLDLSGADPNGISTLNSYDGRTKANAVIVPANTADNNRAISVFAKDDTDVIIDMNGYYVPQSTPSSLAFYPLPPCRAVDTRDGARANGLGTPTMGAGQTRNFSLQSSGCGLPNSALAYALNFTAVPKSSRLAYLTVWPTGQAQPIVSTLNATTGAVTANAAVVPSGSNGQISVYSTDQADLIVDVSGYYAPPTSGGLALYNVSPCRAWDSRGSNGNGTPVNGASYHDATGGDCAGRIPATVQSLVMNATVVPAASLGYLTLWARGGAQPLQSTLNAYDSAVTSNLAVVPTTDGNVAYFVTAPTGLIYDVFGYFAP
jgi:sugar lactone lactonase YvrE